MLQNTTAKKISAGELDAVLPRIEMSDTTFYRQDTAEFSAVEPTANTSSAKDPVIRVIAVTALSIIGILSVLSLSSCGSSPVLPPSQSPVVSDPVIAPGFGGQAGSDNADIVGNNELR